MFPNIYSAASEKYVHLASINQIISQMKMMLFLLLSVFTTTSTPSSDPLADALETATAFVQLVDDNDAKGLAKILHPEMMQFAKIGDDLHPFKTADFIQMVADKKLGGQARTITVQQVQLVRDNTVNVVLHAVSKEYDFMYQIALAKSNEQWQVVGVLSDIKPVQ